MTTVQSPMVGDLWQLIHQREPQAVLGGSVPNLTTELEHSYHRSWQDSPHDGGYSVHYWGDRSPVALAGKTRYAAALDVTFHQSELMIKYTARLHRLALAHGPLNWSFGLREFAGTLDGSTVFAMDTSRTVRTFGWDASHLWHIHLSFNRRFVTARRLLKLAALFGD